MATKNVDVDIELDDVMEFIESSYSSTISLQEIYNKVVKKLRERNIAPFQRNIISANNLYDEQKYELLVEAMEKHSLEQLQEKLK